METVREMRRERPGTGAEKVMSRFAELHSTNNFQAWKFSKSGNQVEAFVFTVSSPVTLTGIGFGRPVEVTGKIWIELVSLHAGNGTQQRLIH
jgi:hypothetical protein